MTTEEDLDDIKRELTTWREKGVPRLDRDLVYLTRKLVFIKWDFEDLKKDFTDTKRNSKT